MTDSKTNDRRTRIAIVVAEFNQSVSTAMQSAAERECELAGAVVVKVVHTPGCYEIPIVADLLLASPDVQAVVVLGYIEKGETLHGEVMGHVVQDALVRMQLLYHKPVGIGIIGPGATSEQAELRKVSYAQAAVRSAVRMQSTTQELSGKTG